MNAVLILAKEGSIGLPRKNLWKIKGRTLLEWVIDDAKKARLVDKIFVSTNGEETAEVAKRAGVGVILRDQELARNDRFLEAVDHAVKAIRGSYPDLEIVALPECVVPFRDPDLFDRCISFLMQHKEYDSIVTVKRVNYIPEALMRLDQGFLVPYFKEAQDRVPVFRQGCEAYEIDHTLECFRYSSRLKRGSGLKPWCYLGERIKAIEQTSRNPNCSVDVHTIEDAKWLEFLVEKLGFDGMSAQRGKHEVSSVL